jgi:MoaA/NifB/PqqE/SkfB family radical SAM enzyme
MHQFIGQSFTKPCCEYTTKSDLPPLEFWNSKELSTMRTQLESGIWPYGCSTCKTNEENQQHSLRKQSCEDFDMPDSPKVEYLDVRLSNKCNFACRSCEPMFSSRISKENNLHGLENFYGYKLDKNYVEHSDDISRDIKMYIPTVKRIMFTGGEPTYMDQFYQTLDEIINQNKQNDIELLVTTNASLISNKFLDYAAQFSKLHITLSIDAIGKPAEYIRYGTDWATVDAGIQKVLSIGCSVMFNTVLTAYSVPYLESLVNYIIQYERDHYRACMYICAYPEHLHPCVLPSSNRPELIQVVDNCIKKLSASNRDYSNAIIPLNDLKLQLETVFYDDTKFKDYTQRLDLIRNQNYKNLGNT